jgi:transcriptional regulator with GAF, ATPase, and Fis domain
MTREFDAKLQIVMEEQYHNKEKIKALEETIAKQNNEITKLQNMEETLNEIVNEMTLRRKKDRKDTILVNEEPHNIRSTSEVNQRQSSHRPITTFAKHSMPTRIHIKGTHMMDKKDTNRFDRRSELPINRGRHVQYICPLNVSNYFTSV